jgi:hypothetical protein
MTPDDHAPGRLSRRQAPGRGFAALALIGLRQFREFAFAMCVGVLIDAFVPRKPVTSEP